MSPWLHSGVLLLIGLLLLSSIMVQHATASDQATPEQLTGQWLPGLRQTLADRGVLTLEETVGTTLFIEILDPWIPEKIDASLEYSNLLAATYGERGLIVVCLFPARSAAMDARCPECITARAFHLIPAKVGVRELLQLSEDQAYTLLVSPCDTIRFSLPGRLLTNDQKRQVVERWMLGSPQYNLNATSLVGCWWIVGQPVPTFEVKALASGSNTTLASLIRDSVTCIWFPVQCTTCTLSNYNRLLSALQQVSVNQGYTLILLLSSLSASEETNLQQAGIQIPAYAIVSPSFDQSAYVTRQTLATCPQLLLFTDQRLIGAVVPLTDPAISPQVCFEQALTLRKRFIEEGS
ncbi:MAG: hypothetical protein KAY24_12605 [Candidatus Eisenbacteria sp.]|nr:hypothetical protein [Candidatus Eisenbacteria bacterium]